MSALQKSSLIAEGYIPLHVQNDDLCHIKQVRVLTVGNFFKFESIPISEFIEYFNAMFCEHTLCNASAMESFIANKKVPNSWYRIKTDVWFLGTSFSKKDDILFPYLAEGRKIIKFANRDLTKQDRIAFL